MPPAGDRPSQVALAEAAAWIARLHADSEDASDQHAFRSWLTADPSHQAAFAVVTETWDAAGGLRDVSIERHAPAPLCRRGVLAGIGTALVALGSFGVWQGAYAGVYRTGLGEQRRVNLDDGSELLLDTETRVRVTLGTHMRQVALAHGRVNCRVAADTQRPFIVDAGDDRIVVAGTTIDVRRDLQQVSVICLQGDAVVQGEMAAQRHLSTGERLKISDGRRELVDRPPLEPLVAWHNGQAAFANESLADAVQEMNRYSRVKLMLGDPRLAALRVSGIYHVGDNEAFAQSVASLLPVLVQRQDGDLVLVPDPAQKLLREG